MGGLVFFVGGEEFHKNTNIGSTVSGKAPRAFFFWKKISTSSSKRSFFFRQKKKKLFAQQDLHYFRPARIGPYSPVKNFP